MFIEMAGLRYERSSSGAFMLHDRSAGAFTHIELFISINMIASLRLFH